MPHNADPGHTLEPVLRPARADEAAALTALGLRAKAHWGYSDAFMRACRDELTLTPAQLAATPARYTVARLDGALAGYGGIEPVATVTWELEALFVEPALIGRGVGKRLFVHLAMLAAARGARTLRIQSDPNAAGFYARVGAVRAGELESASVRGRMLPLFELDLSTYRPHGNHGLTAPRG